LYAKQTIVAELARASTGCTGRVRIVDERGVMRGERKLPETNNACIETVRALALAISIAIDDLPDTAPVEEATSSTDDPPAPPAAIFAAPPPSGPDTSSPAPPKRPPSSSPARSTTFFSARVQGAFGSAPSTAPGATLGFGLQRGWLSGAIELRADLASSRTTARGTVSTATYLVSVAPCGHLGVPFACVLLGAGAFAYSGGDDLAKARSGAVLAAVSGARVGAKFPLASTLDAFVAGDLLATFTPNRVRIDDVEVYRQPLISAAVGIGVVLNLR
jgi:hypothetical protein